MTDHNHLSAAQWQLLQALRLYEEGEDYYSVITLAGAAEAPVLPAPKDPFAVPGPVAGREGPGLQAM